MRACVCSDLRANLEVSVNKVLKINSNIVAMHRMKSLKLNSTSPTTESDNDDDDDEVHEFFWSRVE